MAAKSKTPTTAKQSAPSTEPKVAPAEAPKAKPTGKRAAPAAAKAPSPKKTKAEPKAAPADGQPPADGKAKKLHRSKPSMATYVYRVLKAQHSNTSISAKALGTLNAMVEAVAQELSRRAHNVVQAKTISSKDVHAACRTLFPAGLADTALAYANDAVTKYTAALDAEKAKDAKEAQPAEGAKEEASKHAKVSRQARAKLLLSVSLMEHMLRNGACRVGASAPVFLAAVLESLVGAVVGAAVATTQEAGVTRINRRFLNLAVANNGDLAELFNQRVHVVVPDGGVIPGVAPELTAKPKRARARGAPRAEGTERRHRFRPGTVALRNIQQQQRKGTPLLQHAPFDRAVRALAPSTKRFSPEAINALQQFIEASIVQLLQDANDLVLHAHRKTLQVSDVDLAVKRARCHDRNDTVVLGLAGMRRLSQRAGVKFVGTPALERAQQYAGGLLAACLVDAGVLREHEGVQTLTTRMVQDALQLRGVTLAQ